MSARRGLALVMTVVALTTVFTSAAAATPSTASTKSEICVALVVDGRALGSDVSTSCAKVTKGSTGVDVLEAGGHRVGFRRDGLVCTIDGLPKSGCASVDDTHYWAYFHRAPGRTNWVYSSEGPGTYEPANDTTEGWVYDDGTALTPENVPYAKICPTEAAPSATPTATQSARPSATSSPTADPTTTTTTKAASPPTPTPASSGPRPHHSKPPAHPSPATSGTGSTSPAPQPSTTSAALAGAVPPPPGNDHGRIGLLIGVLVVAALGFAAAVRFRRARR